MESRHPLIDRRFNAGTYKSMLRVRSAPDVSKRAAAAAAAVGAGARPFPAHIFTDRAYQRMREDEEFRALQRDLRQRELMARARLPPRMEAEADVHLKRKLKQVLAAKRPPPSR